MHFYYVHNLYNHKANGDPSVLNCIQTDTEDDHPILRREVEAAIQSLKKGKSAGVVIHHTSQESQPAAVPELLNNKPHQSPKQSHAEDHIEQIEATSEDPPGVPQSRSSTYAFYVRNISNTSNRNNSLLCFLILYMSIPPPPFF